MNEGPDREQPLRFNLDATIRAVPILEGQQCYVIDDALLNPERCVEWTLAHPLEPPQGHAYPGPTRQSPPFMTQPVAEFFASHVRRRLGARRTLDASVRMSMVTTPPDQLVPCQWQCHRDRLGANPVGISIAASVLYLFRDPALGGTSFYRPRLPPAQTEQLVADSLALDAAAFGARYGLQAGYMTDSNDYFERTATISAAWNRLIFYDGGVFHSGDIALPQQLSTNPMLGRLSLNGFFTCRLSAA
jgi:Family of unknown function (DUF6445)